MSARWRASPATSEIPAVRGARGFLKAVVCLVLAAAAPARAETLSTWSVFLNGGLAAHHIGRPASDPSGSSSLGTVYPHFSLYGRFPIDADVTLGADLGYTLPGRTLGDGAGTATLLTFSIPLSLSFGELELKGAPGLLLQRISGNGGTTIQRSGNSEATYPLPSRAETSRVLFLSAGAGLFLNERVRTDFDLLMSGAGSGRLSVSGILRIGMGIL